MSIDQAQPSNDLDSTLLEGLLEMAINGESAGSELDKLTEQVYSRLESAYASEEAAMAALDQRSIA